MRISNPCKEGSMARYRGELDDRDFYERERRMGREDPGYEDPLRPRRGLFEQRGLDSSRSRFGERAEYDNDEPRYGEYRGRSRDEGFRDPYQRGEEYTPRSAARPYAPERSRLRCRDIMTRDLVVATRETLLREVAEMMKQEDTGVIPVVEYPNTAGNGRTNVDETTRHDNRTYGRGKLIGLITDRDIVVRAVAEDKECATTRSEDIMTTDISTARPNDRVVEVIRKMGQKQVRRIPVTGEDERLLGMISMADVAIETEADQELADALEEISKGSSFWRSVFG